jgi:hypothetical protein
MRVLSNTFKYEDRYNQKSGKMERTAVDYDPRLLHSFNKYEFLNEVSKSWIEPMMRKHVMVLGDLTQDPKMVEKSKYDQ